MRKIRRLLTTVLAGGGLPIVYTINDTFTTDRAGGAVSTTAAEPGPGTRTARENDGQFTISSGALQIPAQSSAALGDLVLYYGEQTRAAGLAMVAHYRMTTSGNLLDGVGFFNNVLASADAHREHTFGMASSTSTRIIQGTSSYANTIANYLNTDVNYCIILRSTGAFYIRDYRLCHVAAIGNTASLYPLISTYNAVGYSDYIKVAQLGGPWLDAYGPGALAVSGAISASQAFTHEANALVYFTLTSNGTAGETEIHFRKQDENNYWMLTIGNDGSGEISEIVAGVETSRDTAAAGVFTDSERVCISIGGIGGANHIRVFDVTGMRMDYTSATNFATATAGVVATLATDAVLSNLEIYPVDLSGLALQWLQVFF